MKKDKLRQLGIISPTSLIEEGEPSSIIRGTAICIISIVVVFILWSALTTIRETTTARGEVKPLKNIPVLQNISGGIVKSVLIKNGDYVEKDQAIIILDPTVAKTELNKFRSQQVKLLLDKTRLVSYTENVTFKKINWGSNLKNIPYSLKKETLNILIKDQKKLFEQQEKQIMHKLAVIEKQIDQQKTALKRFQKNKDSADKQFKLFSKELGMYKKLKSKRYVSERDYLIAQRNLNESLDRLETIKAQIVGTNQSLQESKNRLSEIKSSLNENALQQLNETNYKLLDIEHTIKQLMTIAEHQEIKAPDGGVIKGLELHPGSVIEAGKALADIIPLQQEFIAEVKVPAGKIGHIKIGDQAKIKVMAYDFARYGSIPGKVTSISAYTFSEKDDPPYYKVTILLNKNYVGKNKDANILRAGMTIEANVITGEKSLLSYLTKPIFRSANTAFREK